MGAPSTGGQQPTPTSADPDLPPPVHRLKLQDIAVPVWRERKRVLVFSFVVAGLVLGISFLLPVYYRASAVLLPETEKSELAVLGQFAGIASLAGIDVSGGDLSRLYPVIATSEAVLGRLMNRRFGTERYTDAITLLDYLDPDEATPEENFEEALKTLRKLIAASHESRTQTVTLTMEMREPKLAADALNALIEELDRFIREERTTSASEQAKWISERLEEVEAELRSSEDSLKEFRERNRRVVDSPELLLQQARLEREITVKSTIFVELKRQHELAKIDEIKNVSIVNILDSARAPVRKVRPRRGINTALGFLAAFVLASAFYGLWPTYEGRVRAFMDRLKSPEKNARS